MKIGVALSQTLVIYVEVDELGTVEEIKVLLEVETNIIVSQQRLIHNNSELRDNTPILESGILEGMIQDEQTSIKRLGSLFDQAVAIQSRESSLYCPACHAELEQQKCKVICRSEQCIYRIVYNCSEF